MIIDFHTHILPNIDDGSTSVEKTKEILTYSKRSGVDIICATPHFYANLSRIDRFLEKRQNAYGSIKTIYNDDSIELPEIYIGAEVAFFDGIGRAADISKLAISKVELDANGQEVLRSTGNILIEMPFTTWGKNELMQIEQLIRNTGHHVIVAHLERYMGRNNKMAIKELLDLPVSVQINAESLLDWKSRGKLIKMLKKGQVQVLGSDCHGMNTRKPNLMEGRGVIQSKVGASTLEQIDRYGLNLLNKRI